MVIPWNISVAKFMSLVEYMTLHGNSMTFKSTTLMYLSVLMIEKLVDNPGTGFPKKNREKESYSTRKSKG